MNVCKECGAPLIVAYPPGEPGKYRTFCERIFRLTCLRYMELDKRPVTHADLPADVKRIVP